MSRRDTDPNRGNRRVPLSTVSAADLLGLNDDVPVTASTPQPEPGAEVRCPCGHDPSDHDDAHHFQFSTKFDGNGRRRCGECFRPYDDGDHIEITTLKPYTHYVCPTGGGLGHSSRWTGAYRLDGRSLRDHLCGCGAELVEEDREQWQLSWEMQNPFSEGRWVPTTVVRSRHAAQEQHNGLLQLIDQGKPIRNVVLEQLAQAATINPSKEQQP